MDTAAHSCAQRHITAKPHHDRRPRWSNANGCAFVCMWYMDDPYVFEDEWPRACVHHTTLFCILHMLCGTGCTAAADAAGDGGAVVASAGRASIARCIAMAVRRICAHTCASESAASCDARR